MDSINFQIIFPEAGTLKKILETLSGLIKDTQFNISEQGLTVEAIDDTRITLVTLLLPHTFFDHYRCERACSIGVRVASFIKVIRFCSNDDKVTLSQRSTNSDQLDVLVESRKYNQTMSFVLKLFSCDADQIEIPQTSFESTVILDSARFAGMIRDLSGIGDTCRVTTNMQDKSVSFEVSSDDTSVQLVLSSTGLVKGEPESEEDDEDGDGESKPHVKKDRESDSYGETEIHVKQEVDKKYPIRYLTLFSKAASLSQKVKLELSNSAPMAVSFKIGEENSGKMGFLLAYKMDEGDDDDEAPENDEEDDL